ncbi:MAG: hypothetical protein ACRBF0_04555 [Calditrichia bacterium]
MAFKLTGLQQTSFVIGDHFSRLSKNSYCYLCCFEDLEVNGGNGSEGIREVREDSSQFICQKRLGGGSGRTVWEHFYFPLKGFLLCEEWQ